MNRRQLTIAAVVLFAAAALSIFLRPPRRASVAAPVAAPVETQLTPSNIDAAAMAEFNSNVTATYHPLPTNAVWDRQRLRARVGKMTPADKARFEKAFPEEIKPAVERWAKIYAGHLPFAVEDVTPDKLKDCILPDRDDARSYVFVINGTTLEVTHNNGSVFVDYLMAAARQLMQVGGGQMPATPSMTRDEILALLKADSGKDFPPDQISIWETAHMSTMNGGVGVDVGKGVNGPGYMAFTDWKYGMVFDPQGNLACYSRGLDFSGYPPVDWKSIGSK